MIQYIYVMNYMKVEVKNILFFNELEATDPRSSAVRPHPERPGKPSVKGRNTITSWDIHVNFRLTIEKVSKIIVDDNSKVHNGESRDLFVLCFFACPKETLDVNICNLYMICNICNFL